MQIIRWGSSVWMTANEREPWSAFERLLSRHRRPTTLILKILGVIWSIYFIGHLKWQGAIALVVGCTAMGTLVSSWNSDDEIAPPTLTEYVQMHTRPYTVFMHILSSFAFLHGVFSHSTFWIFSSTTLYFVGHFGMDKRIQNMRRIKPHKVVKPFTYTDIDSNLDDFNDERRSA